MREARVLETSKEQIKLEKKEIEHYVSIVNINHNIWVAVLTGTINARLSIMSTPPSLTYNAPVVFAFYFSIIIIMVSISRIKKLRIAGLRNCLASVLLSVKFDTLGGNY